MLNAVVIGQNKITVVRVAKETHYGRVRTIQDPYDAALGALPIRTRTDPDELDLDVIAVHGIADRVGRNKNVAVEVGHRSIGYEKPVSVLMQDESPCKRTSILRSRPTGLSGRSWADTRPDALAVLFSFFFPSRQNEPPAG